MGNVGAGEDDLMTYTMPADLLDVDGKAIRITAWGTGNALDNVTIKLHFGADTATLMAANTVTTWGVTAIIIRTGATTQVGTGLFTKTATAQLRFITASTETLSGSIVVKITGENTGDTSNDAVVQEGMIIEILN